MYKKRIEEDFTNHEFEMKKSKRSKRKHENIDKRREMKQNDINKKRDILRKQNEDNGELKQNERVQNKENLVEGIILGSFSK